MAAEVRHHCQPGKPAAACHDAVATYASHNQAAASGVYGGAKAVPAVTATLVHDTTPTSAINLSTYTNLVNVSNTQAMTHAKTGEFNLWTAGPCNPCYYPVSSVDAATY
jgi:hypothetical protein